MTYNTLKQKLRPYYSKFRPCYVLVYKYRNALSLLRIFWTDYLLYVRYSLAFNRSDFKQKEAEIIIQYHGLEKGMLFSNMKPFFAKDRVQVLHQLLNERDIINNSGLSQINVAYKLMCKYFELHSEIKVDISSYFNNKQYLFYLSVLKGEYCGDFAGVKNWSNNEFYINNNRDFYCFAHSRKSTRLFTGEVISYDCIQAAIELANTAPSVCNRQASSVYLLEEKSKIDQVLEIQGGFKGYSENVNQLLILTNDRKYYYTLGERNQFYIDGGVYLLNLLYALHYYKIGNCPANWGKRPEDEKRLLKVINIPKSEKIICMIPIGILGDVIKTTLSSRRCDIENFIRI